MASAATAEEVQDEAICSICLGYLTEPATIACGHNFCRACLTQHCVEKGEGTPLTCPQCRARFQKGEFRPNTQLNNIIQKVKQLGSKPGKGQKEKLCERHEECLKLFCDEDGETICLVCEKSRDHKSHTVVPIEEAAQEYKEKLQGALGPLRKELEEALVLTSKEKKKTTEWQAWCQQDQAVSLVVASAQQLLYVAEEGQFLALVRWCKLTPVLSDGGKVKNRREMIAGEFNKLHTLLREEEQLLLQSLEEEERETLQRLRKNVTKLSQQSSSLQELITEMEEKCQQPVVELLKDVKNTLSRTENVKLQEPEAVSTDLKNMYKISLDMREALKRLGVDVTLDPDTANPELVLSEDRKCVTYGDKRQDLPNNPERFDPCACVLGAEGFAGGRRYWEVEVGDKPEWALGVCRESVSRKGDVTLSPEDGFWAVWLRDGGYEAGTPIPTPLPVSVRPSQVGIFLDYEAGEVSFYNVTDRSHLFTFTDTFSGKLRPYFSPSVIAGGTNAAPLIICPVPAQAGGNLCP
ncbi:E3 ubiquitin-protein ligase TRIM39-like isoform X1 [Gopherus evgoodei]|uniref:E3 ubiquitin-protein ligase TRIM39-like n=1 Tax=Gopherus evgoodei TaxID=1825980 RepID=A0A8C4Y7K9_9SAUR|nr:E3 ubiquitin-protein ligase TRIM39-like isoform X1 [Gopherus evgoodei]